MIFYDGGPVKGCDEHVAWQAGVLIRLALLTPWSQREVLKDAEEFMRDTGAEFVPGAPFLAVECPCGCGAKAEWQTVDDVPLEDVPCPQGTEGVFLLKHDIRSPE